MRDTRPGPAKAPVLFASHGSPMLALDPGHAWARALGAFGAGLGARPTAILGVSAHWWTRDLRVTAAPRPGVLHDFGGFPEALYALDYPAPGDPALARRVAARTGAVLDEARPWDHGLWSVLRHAFPEADLPVVQLSLPRWTPADLQDLGAKLAPLREEGVLIVASGGLVHNLRRADFGAPDGHPEPWALEAETWILDHLGTEDLLEHRTRMPLSREAAPTVEHLDPLFVALGAAGGDGFRTVHDGWHLANGSLRTLAWEAP